MAGDGLVGDRLVAVETDLAQVHRAQTALGQRQARTESRAYDLGLEGQHLAVALDAELGAAGAVDQQAQLGRDIAQDLGLRRRSTCAVAVDAEVVQLDGVDQRRGRDPYDGDLVVLLEVAAQHDAVDLRHRGRIGNGYQHRGRQLAEILHIQPQLHLRAEVEAGAAAQDLQATDTGISTAGHVNLDRAQTRGLQIIEREARPGVDVLRRAVQAQRHLGLQVHAGTGAHAAGLQSQQTGLGQHLQVLDRQRQTRGSLEVVDAQAEILAVARCQVDDQVETGADVHAQVAHRVGRDRHQIPAQTQVERRLESERVGEVQRHLDLAADCVVAGLVTTEQPGVVQGLDELLDRGDLDRPRVDQVLGLLHTGRPFAVQRQAAAIVGHRGDLDHVGADTDPLTFHRRGKLPDHTDHLVGAGGDVHVAARLGAGDLARFACPGHTGLVEVDLVDHVGLEARGQVERLGQRVLHERDAVQPQRAGVYGLEVLQDIGQGQDQVRDIDLGEVGKLFEVFGGDGQVARLHAADHADLGHGRATAQQVQTRQARIHRYLQVQQVLGGVESRRQLAVDETELGIDRRRQHAALVGLAVGVVADLADAQGQRTEVGAQHHVLGRERATEAQVSDIQAGVQAMGPIQRQVEVDAGMQAGVGRQATLKGHADARQRLAQVDAQVLDLDIDGTGHAHAQTRLV